jgi:hypothetical protein
MTLSLMGILFPVIQVSLSRLFFVKKELVSGAATPFDFSHRWLTGCFEYV